MALEVVGGEVFEDTGGALTALRAAMDWYPDDLWRYLVACDWRRIDQELPLMGRAADRGDDLGSRVIAARLVAATMHLGFLLCRAWPPYAKWRGTLFGRLPLPPGVALNLAHVRSGDPVTARLALATPFSDLSMSDIAARTALSLIDQPLGRSPTPRYLRDGSST